MKHFKSNRKKYYLQTHLVFVVKYRKPILKYHIDKRVKSTINDVANANNWIVKAMETDKDHIHILLPYSPSECVCDIVKIIKQKTTHEVCLITSAICLSVFGSTKHFGPMAISVVPSETHQQKPSRTILLRKVSNSSHHPKGSGFPCYLWMNHYMSSFLFFVLQTRPC